MKSNRILILTSALFLVLAFPCIVPAQNTLEQGTIEQGIRAFQAQEFDTAYQFLTEAFENDPGNLELNFYLGRAAYETGRHEMAVMAFERILIARPGELRIKLEIARAFNLLGDRETARRYCREVLAADPPRNVRENILSFLAAMEKSEQTHFLNGQVVLGYDWNDNVWASPANRTVRTVVGDVDLTGDSASPTRDTAYTATLDLTHHYRPLDGPMGWKTTGTGYLAFYGKTADLDTVYTSFRTGPEFIFKKDRLGFGVSGTQIQLDNDKYQSALGFHSQWRRVFTPGVVLTARFGFRENSFPRTPDEDSREKNFSLETGVAIGNWWLRLGAGLDRESADDDEYSHYKYSGFTGLSRELFKHTTGFLSYEFQYAGYDAAADLFGRHRMDRIHFLGCGVSRKLWQSPYAAERSLFANLNYQHIRADSNIPLYDYDKDLVQFSLSYNF